MLIYSKSEDVSAFVINFCKGQWYYSFSCVPVCQRSTGHASNFDTKWRYRIWWTPTSYSSSSPTKDSFNLDHSPEQLIFWWRWRRTVGHEVPHTLREVRVKIGFLLQSQSNVETEAQSMLPMRENKPEVWLRARLASGLYLEWRRINFSSYLICLTWNIVSRTRRRSYNPSAVNFLWNNLSAWKCHASCRL